MFILELLLDMWLRLKAGRWERGRFDFTSVMQVHWIWLVCLSIMEWGHSHNGIQRSIWNYLNTWGNTLPQSFIKQMKCIYYEARLWSCKVSLSEFSCHNQITYTDKQNWIWNLWSNLQNMVYDCWSCDVSLWTTGEWADLSSFLKWM